MSSSIVNLFCKTAECPASQALLAYCGSSLHAKNWTYIRDHLAFCDFCGAELQLLARYRCDTEEYSFVEMPAQLRRLAKDLLKRTAVPFIGYPELAENRQVFH